MLNSFNLSHQITSSCAAAVQLRQKDLELQLAEVRRKESDEVARDFQVRAVGSLAAPAAPPVALSLIPRQVWLIELHAFECCPGGAWCGRVTGPGFFRLCVSCPKA